MYTVQFLPYTPLSGTAGPYNTVYSYLLHHPLTEGRHILEPDLQLRMNESGSFTFTVTQKHPYYARMLQNPLWDAAVYRDGKFLWAGHPLIQDIDIYGNVTFQCEGVLGYLADNYIGTFSDRKTPGGWLYTFLVRARYQQFLAGGNMAFHRSFWSDGSSDFDYTGAVEPDGSGGYVYSESKNGVRRYSKAPMPAMNAIQTRLIDYFGGMLSVTLEGTESKYRVDYTNPWKRPASLPPDHVFQIGRNITDASVSVDYCSLPRKTQKTDTQNEKNAPEHHVQERFFTTYKRRFTAVLSVQFLVNTGNVPQDLFECVIIVSVFFRVLIRLVCGSCCTFCKSIQPRIFDDRRIILIRIIQIYLSDNAGNAAFPAVLPQPIMPGIGRSAHIHMRKKHVIPFFYIVPDIAFQSRLERINCRIIPGRFQRTAKRLTQGICILQTCLFFDVKCDWILELLSSQSRQAHSSLLIRFCGSFGVAVPVRTAGDSKPFALAVIPFKLHIDLTGFFPKTSP